MNEFLQGHKLTDLDFEYDFLPIQKNVIDEAIRGAYKLIWYPCYFARNHRNKRINKKWHKKYGIIKYTEKEERYFKDHNKRLIYVKA